MVRRVATAEEMVARARARARARAAAARGRGGANLDPKPGHCKSLGYLKQAH